MPRAQALGVGDGTCWGPRSGGVLGLPVGLGEGAAVVVEVVVDGLVGLVGDGDLLGGVLFVGDGLFGVAVALGGTEAVSVGSAAGGLWVLARVVRGGDV